MHACSVTSVVSDSFATSWTVAQQAPLSIGLSRQEYWNESPFPSPGDFPNPGIKPGPPALHVDSLLSKSLGKPQEGPGLALNPCSPLHPPWPSQHVEAMSLPGNCPKIKATPPTSCSRGPTSWLRRQPEHLIRSRYTPALSPPAPPGIPPTQSIFSVAPETTGKERKILLHCFA